MRRLKAWSQPLEDTAESALTKVLDAAESARTGPLPPARPNREKQKPSAPKPPARTRSGAPRKLPQKAFRQPLLEVLDELGGSALVRELRPVMKERVAPPCPPERERSAAQCATRLAQRHHRQSPAVDRPRQGDGVSAQSVGAAGAILRRRALRHRYQPRRKFNLSVLLRTPQLVVLRCRGRRPCERPAILPHRMYQDERARTLRLPASRVYRAADGEISR